MRWLDASGGPSARRSGQQNGVDNLGRPGQQLHVAHTRVYKMWGRKNTAIVYALLNEQSLVKPPKPARKRAAKPSAPAPQPPAETPAAA